MRGTEVTAEQLQSAREFLTARRIAASDIMLDDATQVMMRFGDLARVVAWYGALRYQAAKNNVGGTLEKPGAFMERAELAKS